MQNEEWAEYLLINEMILEIVSQFYSSMNEPS